MAYRYVLGPSFAASAPVVAAPTPEPSDAAAVTKADVAVSLTSVDEIAWKLVVSIPAYDLASFNRLAEIRAYLLPEGAGIPADAQGWVASPFPVTVEDVSAYQDGALDEIPLPATSAGKHLGQIVLGFES